MAHPTTYDSFTAHSADVLRRLVATHEPQQLERALVRKYLSVTHQEVKQNKLLLRILRVSPAERGASVDEAVADVGVTTINDLVKAFELLVRAPEEGGGPGSVFTPAPVADFMASEVITPARRTARVVDPACGCGALLVAALRRLYEVNEGRVPASQLIATQVFGADIDEDGVRRVEILLSVVALELGDDAPTLSFHIRHFDSLDPENWTGDMADHSFDVVIGNPPYVRYHELDEETRAELPKQWSVLGHGNYNLYFAFFELAGHLRAPGGAVAYITPSAYFRAASAAPLREWMTDTGFPTKVVDFGYAQVFSDAMTYTAITLSDGAGGKLSYFECPSVEGLAKAGRAGGSKFSHKALGAAPWPLVGKRHREAVGKLSAAGRPLLEVAEVRYGLATLRDKLYLLGGTTSAGRYTKELDGETFAIEPSATRPVVRVSDAPSQDALDKARTRIIFPYKVRDGRVVVWSDDELLDHPGAHEYLKAIAGELAQRDRGRKTYAAWFAYGRSQGLTAKNAPRLLTPLYAARPRFLTDTKPNRLFLNGCAITPKPASGVSLELLAAVLNSGVLHYFIEQTSSPITGGFYSYQKGPLGAFRIPAAVVDAEAEVLARAGAERNELLAGLYGIELPAKYL